MTGLGENESIQAGGKTGGVGVMELHAWTFETGGPGVGRGIEGVAVMHRSDTFSDWDSYYTDWDTIQNGVCHSGTPLTHCDSCYDCDEGL